MTASAWGVSFRISFAAVSRLWSAGLRSCEYHGRPLDFRLTHAQRGQQCGRVIENGIVGWYLASLFRRGRLGGPVLQLQCASSKVLLSLPPVLPSSSIENIIELLEQIIGDVGKFLWSLFGLKECAGEQAAIEQGFRRWRMA